MRRRRSKKVARRATSGGQQSRFALWQSARRSPSSSTRGSGGRDVQMFHIWLPSSGRFAAIKGVKDFVPEAQPDISRWCSATQPPERRRRDDSSPERAADEVWSVALSGLVNLVRVSGGSRFRWLSGGSGFRWLRSAPPPANIRRPSGTNTPPRLVWKPIARDPACAMTAHAFPNAA
jgi:hypothetical protein